MKQYSRASFLLGLTGVSIPPVLNQYINNSIPSFSVSRNKGLKPYVGAWGQSQLLHLLRRSLIGVSQTDYAYFAGKTLSQCLDILLIQSPEPLPPINAYNDENYTDPDVPFGQTWVNAPFGDIDGQADDRRIKSLKSWWIGLMLNQDHSLTEKMTLFWSNSVAAQMFLMKDSRYDYQYLKLLRSSSLGNFKTFVKNVTITPGMLVYQNGNSNTDVAPNENYARELQELFTVGKGPESHYTQGDVEAAARALTGWEEDYICNASHFNPLTHDTSDKQFSWFYNNTIIKGRSGLSGGDEKDDLIHMIFHQKETAKHFCRKIYRWFVYYVIDEEIEKNVISPLADILIKSDFEVVPVLRALLGSEHFFDTLNMGCCIKNPIDFLIGACRQFEIALPPSTQPVKQYEAWELKDKLQLLGMEPGEPPGVSGWQAYYQQPGYHELWINSTTLPLRNMFTDSLISDNGFALDKATLKIDLFSFVSRLSNPGDPNKLITDSAVWLSPNPLDTKLIADLKSILLSGQTSDHYWTDAWQTYKANQSDEINKKIVGTRLTQFYTYLMQRPEYQLM